MSTKCLAEAYVHLSRHLSAYYNHQIVRTNSELGLLHYIRKSTGLGFETSVWIGNRNIDLFCPCLAGESPISKNPHRFKGLAIEVDGSIHNTQWKMNKDNSRNILLHKLGIALYTVENEDIRSPNVQSFVRQLKTLPRLDSRGRRRVRRNVHLVTLMAHLDSPTVSNLLSPAQYNLLFEMKGLL